MQNVACSITMSILFMIEFSDKNRRYLFNIGILVVIGLTALRINYQNELVNDLLVKISEQNIRINVLENNMNK